VQPTDFHWAFPKRYSLAERYGVIAGYPDGALFRGAGVDCYEFCGWFELLH